MAILTELRDPRVRDVTVTHVEVAPDMRSAKVHVSIMGNESRQNLSLAGLRNAAGFLQQRIAARIDTRYTPRLQFVLDQGVKNSIAVARILREVLKAETSSEPSETDADSPLAVDPACRSDEAGGADSDSPPIDRADDPPAPSQPSTAS